MKLAIVGNSHVGMLKAASDRAAYADVRFGWFANAGRGLQGVSVQGSRLVAGTKRLRANLQKLGLPDELDVDAYDATVLVGTTASALNAAYILRNHVVGRWLAPKTAASLLEREAVGGGVPQFLSEDGFVAALVDIIRANLTYEFVRELRRATQAPLVVLPQPFLSEMVLSPDAEKYKVFNRVQHLGVFAETARALSMAHVRAFEGFDAVHVLEPPEETIANGLFTQQKYTQGSVRLDQSRAHVAADMLHANAEYGALCLDNVVNQFS